MYAWIYFVACNLLIALSNADNTPSPQFLKRAYCACVCCESKAEDCYRHPVIEEDYECIQDDCTEKLCEQLSDAKCKASCYCEKCKDSVLFDDFKCQSYKGVIPEGCDCGKTRVDCGDESAETKDTINQYNKMKEQTDCLVPCFCKKCADNVAPNIQEECDKSGPLPSHCSCETTVCPTQEQIVRLKQIMNQEQSGRDLVEKTITDSWTGDVEDAEVDEINKKLSKAIRAGVMQPMTKTTLFSTKCKLHCYCDACRWSSPELEANCKKVLTKKVHGCPACPGNLECPEVNPEANCKLYCFCLQCKADQRMPNHFKDKCKEIMAAATDICPCTEQVDCNVLSQLDQALKSPVVEQPNTSEDGKPRPGKMKQKHKMWDEL